MTPELSSQVVENTLQDWIRRQQDEIHQHCSDAVKRGMALKVAAGHHVHRTPVGYQRVWRDRSFVIEPDPLQSVHIHRAFELMAKGSYSMSKLLQILTREGLAKPDGSPFTVSGLRAMLTNPFYMGMVRNAGMVYQGAHHALISKATFDLAQQSLQANKRPQRSPLRGTTDTP